jgi:hypothetical protein
LRLRPGWEAVGLRSRRRLPQGWVAAAEKADAMKVGRVLAPAQFDRALWIDQSF